MSLQQSRDVHYTRELEYAAYRGDTDHVRKAISLGGDPFFADGYPLLRAMADRKNWVHGSTVQVISDYMFGPAAFDQLSAYESLGLPHNLLVRTAMAKFPRRQHAASELTALTSVLPYE